MTPSRNTLRLWGFVAPKVTTQSYLVTAPIPSVWGLALGISLGTSRPLRFRSLSIATCCDRTAVRHAGWPTVPRYSRHAQPESQPAEHSQEHERPGK